MFVLINTQRRLQEFWDEYLPMDRELWGLSARQWVVTAFIAVLVGIFVLVFGLGAGYSQQTVFVAVVLSVCIVVSLAGIQG